MAPPGGYSEYYVNTVTIQIPRKIQYILYISYKNETHHSYIHTFILYKRRVVILTVIHTELSLKNNSVQHGSQALDNVGRHQDVDMLLQVPLRILQGQKTKNADDTGGTLHFQICNQLQRKIILL